MNPLLRKYYNLIDYHINKFGSSVECNICGKKAFHYQPFRGGYEKQSDFLSHLNMVGGIRKNYGCVHCGSTDRERNLFIYFEKLNFWDKFKGAKILHGTPERNVRPKIKEQQPLEYIQGDINPEIDPEYSKIDVTNITYKDNYFDVIIYNHVLEHVEEYHKALSEIYRVLKPGGYAILQTPFSKFLKENFTDKAIQTEEDRLYFYGLGDHVRVFAEPILKEAIKNAGFKIEFKDNNQYITPQEVERFGVNPEEELLLVSK